MHKWTLIAVIGLKWGLHPHPLKDLGVQPLPELHLSVPTPGPLPGFPGPPLDLACYPVRPDDPWMNDRMSCGDHPALLSCLWCHRWGHHSARTGVPSAPWREQCCSMIDALLLNSGCLKMQVHFRKAILPSCCCCWLPFIKGYKHRYFKANLGRVLVKIVVTYSPHSNQSSFLQHSSNKACLSSGYLGCSFMSGLHHLVFVPLLKRDPALVLCHTLLLPQLTHLAED